MKNKRKGTASERTAPNNTHSYLNKVENNCLMLFIAFLSVFIGGYYFHNEPMTYLGLGLGIAGALIQTTINIEEE